MPKTGAERIPEWARREREGDLRWLGANLFVLWPAAKSGFEASGRGALTIDTTRVVPSPVGRHNVFVYLPQAAIEKQQWNDALRMVSQYDPSWEFVAVLLKGNRDSAYRIGVPSERGRTKMTPG